MASNPPPVQETTDLDVALEAMHATFSAANRILFSTHENPDGDGVGSQLALCEHMKALDKECRVLNCTPVPYIYQFMDEHGWLEDYDRNRDEAWLASCDLAIVLDLGDFRRLRAVGEDLLKHDIPLAGIDHHRQSGFDKPGGAATYRHMILDYSAPSTGTLIWQYFQAYREEPLTLPMAEALYTALITDTGSFRYDNTDERAHLMAIDLLKAGVQPYSVHRRVYEQRKRSQVKLLGMLINNLQYSTDGRIGWCALTQPMLTDAEATREDVDGFSDFIRTIRGVEVAVLMTETSDGGTKLNLRSKGAVAINGVAQQLGGGGHPFASGALVYQPWDEIIARLVPMLDQKIAETLDHGKPDTHGS